MLHDYTEDYAGDTKYHRKQNSAGNLNVGTCTPAHSEDERHCHTEAEYAHEKPASANILGLPDFSVPVNALSLRPHFPDLKP